MSSQNLKEAEKVLKEYYRRDDADMGSLAFSCCQWLVEYCKLLEERIKELEQKINP